MPFYPHECPICGPFDVFARMAGTPDPSCPKCGLAGERVFTAPTLKTDTTFLAIADNCNGKQFEKDPKAGDYYRRMAERAGVSTTGKIYMPGLAAFPGDPRAWVSDRGDVRRICEVNGWGCDGAVKVKAQQFEHKPVAIAEDIVQEEVKKVLEQDPDAKVEDVREKVIQKRKPHWAK